MATSFVLTTIILVIYLFHGTSEASTSKALRMRALMNTTANPCQDFSQYSCGTLYNTGVIPPHRTSVGSFEDAVEREFNRYKKLLVEPVQHQGNDSYERKIKTFYKACMDTEAIESYGLKDYKKSYRLDWPSLNEYWLASSYDLQRMFTKSLTMFVQPLFYFYVYGNHSSQGMINILEIFRPVMFLNSYYLQQPRSSSRLLALERYYKDVAVALGGDNETAACDAEEVVGFITEFHKMISAAEDNKNYSGPERSTIRDMNQHFPYLDWVSVFRPVFAVFNITFDPSHILNTPKYLMDLGKFLSKFDKKVIQNYFAFKIATEVIGGATEEMRRINFDFDKAVDSSTIWKSRDRYCYHEVYYRYHFGLAKLMSRTRYTSDVERSITELIRNIKGAYIESFTNMTWVGNATKQKALLKLDKMIFQFGIQKKQFEDKDLDERYKHFVVEKNRYNANRVQNYHQALVLKYERTNKIEERWRWNRWVDMTAVNPEYNIDYNEVVLPLGVIQKPFFGIDLPSYMNYAALGYTIGHEIGHAFDTIAWKYNEYGLKEDWWTPRESKEYEERTKCFRKQYSKFELKEVNMTISGNDTIKESVADNFGSIEAYKAYKTYANQHAVMTLPGLNLTNDQLFFLSMAHDNCEKYTPHLLRWIVYNGILPSVPRINGMMQNHPEFAKAFNCKPGDHMNPGDKRCSMW